MFRLGGAVVLAVALSGCSKPSLESYVFRTHGPSAVVVDAPEPLPRKRAILNSNQFKIAVGAVASPKEISPFDIFDQRSAVWSVDRRCSHRAFSALGLKPTALAPGALKYSVNVSNAPTPDARSVEMRELFPNLPEKFLGYLDYVAVNINNVRLYQANSAELDKALEDIKTKNDAFNAGRGISGSCPILSEMSTRQIERIVVADFSVDVGFSAGIDLSDRQRQRVRVAVIRSWRYRNVSSDRIFALVPR